MKLSEKQYSEMVKRHSPLSSTAKNAANAFVFGGAICAIAEGIGQGFLALGATSEQVSSLLPVTMVAIGVGLTALGLYKKLAKRAGAGTIVPITGFANAIASAAIEFSSEGIVFGTCVRMFSIAGPVLVYGVAASVIYGIVLLAVK